MAFYDSVNQVVALLQRRGRVSYRALKRQFDLDDAHLDDLKFEPIEDLVGSTALSTTLDPEDLRELLRTYQAAGAGVIERYGGVVARQVWDGLLVNFGYPQAHEDAAGRAARAALAIVAALPGSNSSRRCWFVWLRIAEPVREIERRGE